MWWSTAKHRTEEKEEGSYEKEDQNYNWKNQRDSWSKLVEAQEYGLYVHILYNILCYFSYLQPIYFPSYSVLDPSTLITIYHCYYAKTLWPRKFIQEEFYLGLSKDQ